MMMNKLPTVHKHGVDIPIYPGFTAIVKKYRNGTVAFHYEEQPTDKVGDVIEYPYGGGTATVIALVNFPPQ